MSKIGFFNHNPNSDIEKIGQIISDCMGNDRYLRLDASDGFQTVANDGDVQICIFHSTPDNWNWDELNSQGQLDRSNAMLFCIVSSAPMEPEITPIEGNIATHYRFTIPNLSAVGLLNRPDSEMKLAWTKLIGALCDSPFTIQPDGSVSVSDKISSFLNPDKSSPLAFRLLCEAWYEVNVTENKELSGFPINAPDKLDDWLAPFSPDENGDPATVASVVATMGDTTTKEKVEKVLQNANGTPKAHVLAFLGIKEEETDQTEGGVQ